MCRTTLKKTFKTHLWILKKKKKVNCKDTHPSLDKIAILFYLFYFWLRWVFVAVHGLSLVAASRGYASLGWLLIAVASLVAEHGI